jgi:hypothetical protein
MVADLYLCSGCGGQHKRESDARQEYARASHLNPQSEKRARIRPAASRDPAELKVK